MTRVSSYPPCTTRGLAAVVYTSRAAADMSLIDIAEILRSSRLNNRACGITGVLLYFAGHFMQYIEGRPADLQRLYRVIRTDKRHHSIIELHNGSIAQREFPDWRMAFATPELPDADPTFAVQDLYVGGTLGRDMLKHFLEQYVPSDGSRSSRRATPLPSPQRRATVPG